MRKLIPQLMMAAALAFAAPVSAHKLIDAGQQVDVARSDMMVTPATDWNRLNQRPGDNAERWTLDGELLNDVVFYAIPADEPLVREVDRRDRPLPQFQANMLPIDVPQLLESTKRVANDVTIFTVTSSEPAALGSAPGIRFTYQFVGGDELRRNGEAVAAIAGGTLYMVSYEAPELYYFDKDLANYRGLIGSVRLPAN